MNFSKFLPVLVATSFVGGGIALAATTNLESLRVGTAGQGGVTFFNGSIVNEEGPVVIADDLRVDGRISRLDGQEGKPVMINDDLVVEGTILPSSGSISISPHSLRTNANGVILWDRDSFQPQDGNSTFYGTFELPQGSVISSIVIPYDAASGSLEVKVNRLLKTDLGDTQNMDSLTTETTITSASSKKLHTLPLLPSALDDPIDNTEYVYNISFVFTDVDVVDRPTLGSPTISYTPAE